MSPFLDDPTHTLSPGAPGDGRPPPPALTHYDNRSGRHLTGIWKLQKLYLAGPMRGHERFNFPAFLAAAKKLRSMGFTVWNPAEHDIEQGFDYDNPQASVKPLAEYMMADLPQVLEADAIVLLDGWEESVGAKLEHTVATTCGIPAYAYHNLALIEEEEQTLLDAVDELPPGDYTLTFKDAELAPTFAPFQIHQVYMENGLGHFWKTHVGEGTGKLWTPRDNPPVVEGRGYETAMEPDGDGGMTVTGERQYVVTNPVTGGQKETRPARFDLLPWDQLWKIAELYAYGATKYEDRNWELGYEFHLSIAALTRHLAKFAQGESIDRESGQHHLASVVFHALALMRFEQQIADGELPAELDDRPDVGFRPDPIHPDQLELAEAA